MGLLAPLYALAALAVVGPIVFHLIRRQPRGQREFSSLMFLSPSPPRLTRRSRLDNVWLLLLRILAIALIALAFARPYLRQAKLLNANLSGRNIVLLLDTSASMQRTDVWSAAQVQLSEVLDDLSADDRVALYTIDDQLSAIVPLSSSTEADAATTQSAVRVAARQLQPSWQATQLALGLRAVADALTSAEIAGVVDPGSGSEIVLISDLHTECGLESLQGFPWPASIQLDVRRILPATEGNARPSLLAADPDNGDERPRIRIENNANSGTQSFQLEWCNASGPVQPNKTRVQVPAGQVRVVPVAEQPTGADRVRLTGDAWSGDNDVFVCKTEPRTQRIAFVGPEGLPAEESLSYFVSRAPLDTNLVRRQIEVVSAGNLLTALDNSTDLTTIWLEADEAISLPPARLREFAKSGGSILISLARPSDAPGPLGEFLGQLLDEPAVGIAEAPGDDFALVGSVDYRHPVFAPFAAPRFNDFSKIRFWSHRLVKLEPETSLKTVASFDDQSPWLLQQSPGAGHIWIMTCGWQPSGSSLGLSSKFVPILLGLLDPAGAARKTQISFAVGENIAWDTDIAQVMDSQSLEVQPPRLAIENGSLRFFEPGWYVVSSPAGSQKLAIQVPVSESRLVLLDTDVFEQYGISQQRVSSDEDRRRQARQMQIQELEQKQRIWQWLLAAGLIILAIETGIAGWLSRTRAPQPVTSSTS